MNCQYLHYDLNMKTMMNSKKINILLFKNFENQEYSVPVLKIQNRTIDFYIQKRPLNSLTL